MLRRQRRQKSNLFGATHGGVSCLAASAHTLPVCDSNDSFRLQYRMVSAQNTCFTTSAVNLLEPIVCHSVCFELVVNVRVEFPTCQLNANNAGSEALGIGTRGVSG